MSLRKELRQPAFRIVFYSLCVMCVMLMLMMRLNLALIEKFAQGQQALSGGDLLLETNRLPEPLDKYATVAGEKGLGFSESYEFSTMASVEQTSGKIDEDRPAFQLVSVKAVDAGYPLAGTLSVETAGGEATGSGPGAGEIYLANTLFERLGVEIGNKLSIGRATLTISGRLLAEPDPSFRIIGAAPRVLMNFSDMQKTEVLQPGSRYEYQLAMNGSPAQLEDFDKTITPQLDGSGELEYANTRGGTLSRAWDRSSSFLALAALATILITLVSLQLALELYVMQQQRIVALQRTLGMASNLVLREYISKLGGALLLALAIGWGGALLIEQALFKLLGSEVSLPAAPLIGSWILLPAAIVVFVCVFQWYPQLRSLLRAPPASLLRQSEDGSVVSSGAGRLWTLLGYGLLVGALALYLGSSALVAVVAGLFVVPLVLAAGLFGLLRLFRRLTGGQRHVIHRSAWQSALANILRRPWWVIPQTAALGGTFGLLLTVFLIRTELVTEWSTQLPPDAPNHFLVNIAPYEKAELESLIADAAQAIQPMYPLVRGRLKSIRGEDVKTTVSKERDVNALNRELNLTWSRDLPDGNKLTSGEWWRSDEDQRASDTANTDTRETSSTERRVKVSVESLLASRLDLEVGDDVVFDIGSEFLAANVSSIREVDWNSLKPNFYMLFEPGALEQFTPSYITSFRVSDGRSAELLSNINRNYPTVSILELGPLIERIQGLLEQVGQGLELLLAIVIAAAVLVVIVVMLREAPVRAHETALFQALGYGRSALRSTQRREFFLVGCASGLVAMVLAQAASLFLQAQVFDMNPTIYWRYWLVLPLGLGFIIALYASFNLRAALQQQPAAVLK